MQRFRSCHARTHRASCHHQCVAFRPVRQCRIPAVLAVLSVHAAPACLAHDAAFRLKCQALASFACIRHHLRYYGSRILHTFLRKCLYHASGNHVVDDLLVLVQGKRAVWRHQQGMVVSHFRGIHTTAVQFSQFPDFLRKGGVSCQPFKQQRYFSKHIFRNMAARCSRIGDELRFIELLHQLQRLFRRESVFRVRLLLQCGQVVQQRRVLHLLLLFHLGDGGAHLRLYLIV